MYAKVEDLERRCLPTAELRLDGAEPTPKITGYAAVFNTWADIGGWFRESIRPGAFAKTIKENDIRALLNHDENYVLGRNKAKTLTLREDDKGLAVTIDPAPTTWANDLLVSMRRGDVNQMSFGFTVNKAETDFEKDERTLTDVTLFDVSVVTYPAYPTTSAQVRSAFTRKAPPLPVADPWGWMHALMAKIEAGTPLTEEEQRSMSIHFPLLSVPVADHTETVPEPACKPLGTDTRNEMRWMQLAVEADLLNATT